MPDKDIMSSEKLQCPHCGNIDRFDSDLPDSTYPDRGEDITIACDNCRECGGLVIWIERKSDGTNRYEILYPKTPFIEISPEIPEEYAMDLREATLTLKPSPRASAALSRRLLEIVLTENFGITCRNLSDKIDEFIKRADVPDTIANLVDAIRQVGNFAAHPNKDQNSGAIADVEPVEAEWCLDVMERVLEFGIVQRKRDSQKIKTLNKKLEALGKLPVKRRSN